MSKDVEKQPIKHTFPFYWLVFVAILIVGRFALLCILYMMDTPTGSSLVPDYNRFIWHTLYAEIGFSSALALLFSGLTLAFHKKNLKAIKITAIVFAAIYLVLSGVDDELQRWMSQKLSLSFIKTYTYAWTDSTLVSKIALGGLGHFLLTLGIVILSITGLIVLAKKATPIKIGSKTIERKLYISTGIIFVLAALGCTSHLWYNYSQRRWDRIRPVVYNLAENLFEDVGFEKEPENLREGIALLGGNPDKEYPFWKESPNEQKSIEEFKNKSLEEKPDILLMTIESLRGWTFDMRIQANCERFPNICKLSQNSLYFPNTYSVGNPSVEGLLGIMTGVISLPTKTLLRDFPNTNLRSFSEILSEAGYYSEVILGADPRFDNEESWYSKWFDYHEFKQEYADDVSSAIRFVERYKERPKDKPTFFHWMSLSMHTPFTLPKKMGETPPNIDDAYLRAAVYMDSAVGIILDSLANDPRFENTLIILTGDHSAPNGRQQQDAERIGMASEGFTWISLMFKGPGITPSTIPNVTSQQNIASSVIGYLGLDVSNHFMGVDLINNPLHDTSIQPIYSFRYGTMAIRQDSTAYYVLPVDGTGNAIAQTVYLNPTWYTDSTVNSFVTGEPVTIAPDSLETITRKMRTAAKAWEYIVYKNRIMPPNKQ